MFMTWDITISTTGVNTIIDPDIIKKYYKLYLKNNITEVKK